MFKSNLTTDAETYFASINSMAKRIVMDTIAVQAGQGEKWHNLNYTDRCELVTKGILKPAISEKYPNVCTMEDSCFPKLNVTSGQKYVFEEENANRNKSANSWRDEHSGPFIWESQSQLNLSYILQDAPETSNTEIITTNDESPSEDDASGKITEENNASDLKTANSKPSAKGEPEGLPTKTSKKKPAPPIPILNSSKSSENAINEQIAVPPQELASPMSNASGNETDEEKSIPKTGFDFLDNW